MFCTFKGLCGFFIILLGSFGHFVALPYCDLTLIACNSSSAVLMNVYISWRFLGEKFVPKYDLSAIAFISVGTIIIILMANKEQQIFTLTTIADVLSEPRSVVYIVTTIAQWFGVRFCMPILLKKLRAFEKDCEDWDSRQPEQDRVLPAKAQSTDD